MNAHEHETLWLAALVAGLGPQADAVVAEAEGILAPSGLGRTCIDAGAALLISVTSRGGRALRLHLRLPPDEPGAARWLECSAPGGDRATRRLYPGATPAAYEEAMRVAAECGSRDAFLADHARLGPYGRLYAVGRRCTRGGRRWADVSWHLDRHLPVATTLERAGLGGAWATAAQVFDELFGYPVSLSAGPWSVCRSYDDDGQPDAVRLGTTRWTRLPDDEAKRRRAADLLAQLGGERSYAEALFRLLDQRRPLGGEDLPIGRAVELDVVADEPVAVELFLCPATPRPPRSLS